MNVLEVLEAARGLISEPTRWTQGALARDARGEQCFANVPRAVQWCAIGALERVTTDVVAKRGARLRLQTAAECLFREVCDEAIVLPAAAVNDSLDHTAVLQMYDCAIKACGGQKKLPCEVIPLHILADITTEEPAHGNA